MTEANEQKTRTLLRIVNPELHQEVADIFFEKHNLHPQDFQADVIVEETGYHLRIKFGENFKAASEIFLTFTEIESNSEKLTTFVKETADTCQEIMVKDYFKMMKP